MRDRVLARYERVCGRLPGGWADDDTATVRAMDAEPAAYLLAQLVELQHVLCLLLEKHEP